MKQLAKRILVVEDERIVARELQLRLRDFGYDVPTTVATAEDAIRSASEHCPDLVLMDIRIRGERDGIETAEILRRRYDVPVVYLTAHSDDATIARAKATGPLGYLLKPLKPGELKSAVEIALYKHEMSRQLRERERWFSTTLRSIGDAVISTDPMGLVTFMNPVAETLTGWRSEDATGQTLGSVLQLVDELTKSNVENPIARALRSGKVVKVEASMTSRQGTERSISDSAAPIIDDQGRVLGGVLVFSDVTDERRLRRQLELSDRLASLGTLAAGVAHEINNPLTYILANLAASIEVLRDQPSQPWIDEVTSALGDAVTGAVRVKAIVADMTVFSRPSSEIRAHADSHRAIQQAVEMTRHQLRGRAELVTRLAPVPPCRIDESRLGQVLVNLLINAAHAIEPGNASRNAVTISTHHDDQRIWIDVADTGSGIPDEIKARIFDPFFTTKQPGSGSGLGLAICHGIITSVDGTITVESADGTGTTFRITVPIAATRRRAARPRPRDRR
jgi:two-component system cell cycle sensor histidine kinase/response regulator CckA